MTKEQLNEGQILTTSIDQCSDIINELYDKNNSITMILARFDSETRDALLTFFRDRRNYLEEKFKNL